MVSIVEKMRLYPSIPLIIMITLFSVLSSGFTGYALEYSLTKRVIYVDDNAPPDWYDAIHVKTINEGIQNATEGDILYVYSGIYHENITITKSLFLIGEEQQTTIIDGCQRGDVIAIETDDVSIRGFTVRNASKNDIWERWGIKIQKKGTEVSTHLRNFAISQCTVTNNKDGILLNNVTDCKIHNCTISNNSHTSLAIRHHSNFIYIDNVSIDNNGEQIDEYSYYNGGVVIGGYSDACTEIIITNCRIFDNIGMGITVDNAYNISINCSHIEKNSKIGIYLAANSKNIIIQHNIISENKWNGIYIIDPIEKNGSLRSIHSVYIQNNTITNNGGDALPKAIDGGILIYNCFNSISIINNDIISNTKYGIYFFLSRNNKVLNNNFINNIYNAYFSDYAIRNIWSKNYWDNWSGFGPKLIIGKFGSFLLPWCNFDWHPMPEPHNLTSASFISTATGNTAWSER